MARLALSQSCCNEKKHLFRDADSSTICLFFFVSYANFQILRRLLYSWFLTRISAKNAKGAAAAAPLLFTLNRHYVFPLTLESLSSESSWPLTRFGKGSTAPRYLSRNIPVTYYGLLDVCNHKFFRHPLRDCPLLRSLCSINVSF